MPGVLKSCVAFGKGEVVEQSPFFCEKKRFCNVIFLHLFGMFHGLFCIKTNHLTTLDLANWSLVARQG